MISRTKRRYAIIFVMVAGMFIFLIGGSSAILLTEGVLNALLIGYLIALVVIIVFMVRDIKTYRRLNMDMWRAQAHTPMSALTNKHCPKCNKFLFQTFFSIGGLPQMYVCKKCGYTGPIGLELKKLKKSKKRKKTVRRGKKRKPRKRRKS